MHCRSGANSTVTRISKLRRRFRIWRRHVKKRQGRICGGGTPDPGVTCRFAARPLGGKHPDVAGSLEELALNSRPAAEYRLDQGDFESPLPVSVKQVVAKS